ncbi:MAG: tyrosine-type recombinase/integrase [Deltaproteobacteria bacterium]|nr:tyrosine-type recombinase/integrase [Deltaproteobacteria bacterium]
MVLWSMTGSSWPMSFFVNALLAYRQTRQSEWVFPDPETGKIYVYRHLWMKRLCKRAGVRTFGILAIRHLTASLLAQEVVPMVQIQAILRHRNLAVTERYLHKLTNLKPAWCVLSRKKAVWQSRQPLTSGKQYWKL